MSTIKTGTITGHPDPNKATIPNTITMGSTTATLNFGNTVITNASAGASTITAEGGSTTTNLQQGLIKAWALNENVSTLSVYDSFNQASTTDTSTGVLTWAVTNNFSSANFVAAPHTTADNASNDVSMVLQGTRTTNNALTDKSSSGTSWYAKNSSHSGWDAVNQGYISSGDLA